MKKNNVIPLGLAGAIIIAVGSGAMMFGSLQSDVEKNLVTNKIQWEMLGKNKENIARIEGEQKVLFSELNGFKEFKSDTKRQLQEILREIRTR